MSMEVPCPLALVLKNGAQACSTLPVSATRPGALGHQAGGL